MRNSRLYKIKPIILSLISALILILSFPRFDLGFLAMVGLLPKVARCVTPWFKTAGDLVVLLGRTREELGASEYLRVVHGLVKGTPPWIDLASERAVQQCCLRAIERGIVRSAHDVSEGGLAVALAECCIGGPEKALGARIETHEMMRADALLFGESQSRIIVSIKERDLGRLREITGKEGAPLRVIGVVGGTRLIIQPVIQAPVDELKSIWSSSLERRLK